MWSKMKSYINPQQLQMLLVAICSKNLPKNFRRSYESYARAVVDVIPSPYDTEALPLHAGDLIGVIHKVLHEILEVEILST